MCKEEFIKKAKELYGEKFDYKNITDNKLESYSTVPIICLKHGIFYTSVYDFLHGEGCFECNRKDN